MATSTSYQVKPYGAPISGLNYRIPGTLLKDTEMTDCRNVHLDRFNCIKKREGYAPFGDNLPLDGIVLGIDQLYTTGGNNELVVATNRNLYTYNPETNLWECFTRGEVIHDCETAWTSNKGAECVCSASTSYAVGTKSAKMAVTAACTTGILAYSNFSAADISDKTQFHVMIKSSKETALGDLWLGVSETNGLGGSPVYFKVPALVAGRWTIVATSTDKDGGAIDFSVLNAVLSVGIYMNVDLGAFDVYVDDFRANEIFTGDASNLWFMDIFDDKLLLTNYVDPIQSWDGSAVTTTDLAGTPPRCVCMRKFKAYFVLGNIYDAGRKPQRIQWCDTGDEENWSTGNAGFFDLMEGVDWITGMEILNDKLIIFKERSIYAGYLVNSTDIYACDLKIQGVGAPAGACIINLGDEIIFLGWDNIYAFNGMTIEAIGDNVKDEIFNRINPSNIYNCHAHIIEEMDEIHFFVPIEEGDYPTEVFVYNYTKRCWTRDTRSNITRCGYYTVQATKTWDALSGSWEDQGFKWDDRSLLASAPSNLMGDSDGMVYEWDYSKNAENDVAFDAYVDTRDFVMDQWDVHKYWMRLDFVASGNTLDIYYSTDEGGSWILIQADYALTSSYDTHHVDFRVSSEKIRFRFRNEKVETFSLRMFTIYCTPGGRL